MPPRLQAGPAWRGGARLRGQSDFFFPRTTVQKGRAGRTCVLCEEFFSLYCASSLRKSLSGLPASDCGRPAVGYPAFFLDRVIGRWRSSPRRKMHWRTPHTKGALQGFGVSFVCCTCTCTHARARRTCQQRKVALERAVCSSRCQLADNGADLKSHPILALVQARAAAQEGESAGGGEALDVRERRPAAAGDQPGGEVGVAAAVCDRLGRGAVGGEELGDLDRVHRSPPKGAREGSRWRLDGPSRRHGGTFRSAGVI